MFQVDDMFFIDIDFTHFLLLSSMAPCLVFCIEAPQLFEMTQTCQLTYLKGEILDLSPYQPEVSIGSRTCALSQYRFELKLLMLLNLPADYSHVE